jgi:hypothetical protein
MNATRMLGADKTIKYDPAKAMFRIRIGNNVKLSAAILPSSRPPFR